MGEAGIRRSAAHADVPPLLLSFVCVPDALRSGPHLRTLPSVQDNGRRVGAELATVRDLHDKLRSGKIGPARVKSAARHWDTPKRPASAEDRSPWTGRFRNLHRGKGGRDPLTPTSVGRPCQAETRPLARDGRIRSVLTSCGSSTPTALTVCDKPFEPFRLSDPVAALFVSRDAAGGVVPLRRAKTGRARRRWNVARETFRALTRRRDEPP